MNMNMNSKRLGDGVEKEYSTFSLTKKLLLNNRIVHVPKLQCLIVQGEEEYLVKLSINNNNSCTCKLKKIVTIMKQSNILLTIWILNKTE